MNQQYVGSPISLISKSGIRYEGILDHIDREQGQVHLRNGMLFLFYFYLFFLKNLLLNCFKI